MQVDLEATGEDPKENPEFIMLRNKFDLLVEMQWWMSRCLFDSWSFGFGIRKNWQVVTTKGDNDGIQAINVTSILKKLLDDLQ